MRKALFIPEHEAKVPERQLLLQMAAIALDSGYISVTFHEGQAGPFRLTPEQLEKVAALVEEILLSQDAFKLGSFKDVPDEIACADVVPESEDPQPQ